MTVLLFCDTPLLSLFKNKENVLDSKERRKMMKKRAKKIRLRMASRCVDVMVCGMCGSDVTRKCTSQNPCCVWDRNWLASTMVSYFVSNFVCLLWTERRTSWNASKWKTIRWRRPPRPSMITLAGIWQTGNIFPILARLSCAQDSSPNQRHLSSADQSEGHQRAVADQSRECAGPLPRRNNPSVGKAGLLFFLACFFDWNRSSACLRSDRRLFDAAAFFVSPRFPDMPGRGSALLCCPVARA